MAAVRSSESRLEHVRPVRVDHAGRIGAGLSRERGLECAHAVFLDLLLGASVHSPRSYEQDVG